MFRLMLKVLIPLFIFVYRLTGGAIGGRMRVLPVLLLTTTGRKSGKQRTVPVAYIKDNNSYIVIASNSGQPKHPAWFHNIKSNPTATVQIGRSTFKVQAEIADPAKKEKLWSHAVKIAPGYEKYQQRTTRDIPVVLLHPMVPSPVGQ
jgi:deazaflavin-dependent oxidoreductase (nitroreductase family)